MRAAIRRWLLNEAKSEANQNALRSSLTRVLSSPIGLGGIALIAGVAYQYAVERYLPGTHMISVAIIYATMGFFGAARGQAAAEVEVAATKGYAPTLKDEGQ